MTVNRMRRVGYRKTSVRDVIEELSKLDPDAKVLISDGEWWKEPTKVRVDESGDVLIS